MSNQLKLSTTILGVIFMEAESRGIPSGRTVYHYKVPEVMIPEGGYQPGMYAIVKGASDRVCLVRVEEVLDGTKTPNKATKAIIGTVDVSHFEKERQRREERAALIEALTRLEAKRQQEAKFAHLAATDEEAAKLFQQLKALD